MFYIIRAKMYNSVITLYYYMSEMRVYYLCVSYTIYKFCFFKLLFLLGSLFILDNLYSCMVKS